MFSEKIWSRERERERDFPKRECSILQQAPSPFFFCQPLVRTAVPFWEQTSQTTSILSPDRDCSLSRRLTKGKRAPNETIASSPPCDINAVCFSRHLHEIGLYIHKQRTASKNGRREKILQRRSARKTSGRNTTTILIIPSHGKHGVSSI